MMFLCMALAPEEEEPLLLFGDQVTSDMFIESMSLLQWTFLVWNCDLNVLEALGCQATEEEVIALVKDITKAVRNA